MFRIKDPARVLCTRRASRYSITMAEGYNAAEYKSWFVHGGVGNYIAGRFAVRAGLLTTAGTLLHHAIELFLKAALVERLSPERLRRRYEHSLLKLWSEFKDDDDALDRHSATIEGLDGFWELRYPDPLVDVSTVLCFGWTRTPDLPEHPAASTSNLHVLAVDEIDQLVIEVLDRAAIDPLLYRPLNPEGLAMLTHRNEHADRWTYPG